jgi:hypothetical protein
VSGAPSALEQAARLLIWALDREDEQQAASALEELEAALADTAPEETSA